MQIKNSQNVLQILKMENEKMFLWAHNRHVNKSSKSSRIKWMGEHLTEKMDSAYYSVGFIFSKGSFQSYVANKEMKSERKITTLPTSKKNKLTNRLDELGEEQFFIDLQRSKNSLFNKKLRTYEVGHTYFKKKWASGPINAKKQFDGIIYIKNTLHTAPIE